MSNLNPGGLTRVLNYVKTWVTGLLNGKANSSHTHTKSQITDFPTIPTVNNATLTIQKNGTTVNSFTANASTNVTANITVPTKTSQLTNDSGFLTAHQSLSNYLTKTATVSEMGRYIDMHYDNATAAYDYDVRLQVNSQGTSNGGGVLQIVGASVKASKFEGPLTGNVTGNCSGSSGSCTGNAATASKLATARSISAGDLEFQGSANFDGSGNIKLNITHHRSLVTVGNTNNYPFHRIAYTAQETGNWLDRVITFFIGREYSGGGYGICRIVLRTNDAANGATASCVVEWLVRTSSIPVDAIQVGFNNTAAASYVDVFYKSSGSYSCAICRVISHASSRTNVGQGFAVVSTSSEVNNTTTSNPLTSTESYATIAAAGTKIRGKAYTSTITASDAGIVNYATYNANGKELVNSIIKGLSVSGRTITYTKLDGSTGTLTTQDTNTTYSNFVKSGSGAAAGLVPAPSTTAGTTKYLREDGTWQVPPDHTYTVNNATLTIQKNGSNVATFTSNASSNVTANISVPTNTNQLTNGAGFITSSGSCNYANSAGSAPANGGTSTATAYMNQYSTITYGVNRLQYYNISTSTTSGATSNANPTNDWYYHLLMSHANNNGYYGDIALCFHSNTLAFRRIASGGDNGWCYIVKNGRTIVSGYEVYVG